MSLSRPVAGRRELLGVGGTEGHGRRWSASCTELVRAIECGERVCYVSFEGHSHLVAVVVDTDGRKTLRTLLGELQELGLPECG